MVRDNYFGNIIPFFDHVDNSAAGPVDGFHIFCLAPHPARSRSFGRSVLIWQLRRRGAAVTERVLGWLDKWMPGPNFCHFLNPCGDFPSPRRYSSRMHKMSHYDASKISSSERYENFCLPLFRQSGLWTPNCWSWKHPLGWTFCLRSPRKGSSFTHAFRCIFGQCQPTRLPFPPLQRGIGFGD